MQHHEASSEPDHARGEINELSRHALGCSSRFGFLHLCFLECSSAEKLTLDMPGSGNEAGGSEILIRQIAGCSTNVTVTWQCLCSPKTSLADKKTLRTSTYKTCFEKGKVAT